MATRTIANGGGNWSEVGTWVEGAVPTAADDVIATGTSGNLTLDSATCLCRSIDLTGYVATLKHKSAVTLSVGSSTNKTGNVCIQFPGSGWTYTLESTTTSAIKLLGSNATQQTIDFGGKSVGALTFENVGSWKFLSGITQSASTSVTVTKGTVDFNGKTLSIGHLASSNANTRSITFGAATVSLTGSGTVMNLATTTGLTFSAAAAAFNLTNTTSTASTFAGGGKAFGTITVSGGGTGSVSFTGANTFTALTLNGPKAVIFEAGVTQTITTFSASGTAGNLITITSSLSGTAFVLSVPAGIISSDYLSLKDSKGEGGASFYAGTHSTNVSGNSGWTFTEPPTVPLVVTGSGSAVIGQVLHGSVNPQGKATTYLFQYVTDAQFVINEWASAASTPEAEAGSGSEAVEVKATVTGLSNGTTYHWRLVATNSKGTAKSTPGTFTPTAGASISVLV